MLPQGALRGIELSGLDLPGMAERIAAVPGVVGVVLGGSRARGSHRPDSDVDLGLYYRDAIDLARLRHLAVEVAGPNAELTDHGGWGPWVDGGGWLDIAGVRVDWLYRDVDRVRRCWEQAQAGRYSWNPQAGHPLGVPEFAYVGELALSVPLSDPSGELGALRASFSYPDPLRRALVANLWEADFLVRITAKADRRGDTVYVAACRSRAILLCAHALHAVERRWVVNEKGAVASAGQGPTAPQQFAERAEAALADQDQALALVAEVRRRCEDALNGG